MLVLVAAVLLSQPTFPLCTAAEQYLRADRQLVTKVEADTLDDWRTHKTLVGCRITSAGGTLNGVQAEAIAFYDRLRAIGGWARTPDPRDAPNEGSLRFRTGNIDCLFNVYGDPMLSTEAEGYVDTARPLKGREVRWHVYAMCAPAMPAAPR